MTQELLKVLVAGAWLFAGILGQPAQGHAQDSPPQAAEPVATRFPAQGLAVLDCAPAAPAPADSCLLRIPPSRTLDRIEKKETGEVAGEFGREADLSRVAPGMTLSKTLVLVDLTPGLGGARKPTWPRERALILDLLRRLPEGQPIALYGFNEGLERLTDFTTDRAVLEQTVAALDLRGTNTRIATNTRDAITLMGAQADTILRNLIVISDGEEEGTRALSEVAEAAVRHGVTVSTLGLFWRPVGSPQNGAGLDYMATLSEGTLGATGGLTIARPAEAQAALEEFAAGVTGALAGSGLIVPRGTPVEADITVVLRKPRMGEAGGFEEERAVARFTPAALRAGAAEAPAEPAPEPAPEPWHARDWQGYPVLWWLIGGGLLAVALLAALIMLLRRSRTGEAEDFPLVDALGDDPAPPPSPPLPPSAPALAYLVREDTGERIAVRRTRVTIGRSESCDVVVADPSVSRLHAELERRGAEAFVLTDSGSLNKTRVNGKVIAEARPLKPGDVVSFGEVRLRFTLA